MSGDLSVWLVIRLFLCWMTCGYIKTLCWVTCKMWFMRCCVVWRVTCQWGYKTCQWGCQWGYKVLYGFALGAVNVVWGDM